MPLNIERCYCANTRSAVVVIHEDFEDTNRIDHQFQGNDVEKRRHQTYGAIRLSSLLRALRALCGEKS